MKVLIVSDASSVHTKRWTKSLKNRGIDVVLYTICPPSDNFYRSNGIRCYYYNLLKYRSKFRFVPFFEMFTYIRGSRNLKKVIKKEAPDIVNAHFASNNGIVAALSGFHPLLVSIWGSDVYTFPKQSSAKLHAFKYVLKKADRILSTSNIMAREISKYTSKKIYITPFGVDLERFKPKEKNWDDGTFRIGIVKSLSKKYGLDYLIRAFHKFYNMVSDENIMLEIVGKGEERHRLMKLTENLGICDQVVFRGFVDNEVLPDVYKSFDVCVFLSLMEGFGVSVVEAMACGCPVITSDADGFTEIIENGVSGLIVPKKNADAAAEAIFKLYSDRELRQKLSVSGRKRVERLYDWTKNVDKMISIYDGAIPDNCEESEKEDI